MLATTWSNHVSRARHSSTAQRAQAGNRRRKAASAVEFAFVAPIFFLLILGLIELSRGIMVKHMLMNAARQGCRVGVLEGKGNSDIQAAAASTLTPIGISSESVVVQVNDGVGDALNASADSEVTVIVSVPVSAVTWVPGGMYLSGTLSGQFTMRKE
jgi:Flp pilus assembly protein TadG